MPVAFDELVSSPRYSGNAGELTAIREGIISWGAINTLYAELFPGPVAGKPSLPALLSGSTVLFADEVEFAPFHSDGEIVSCSPLNSYDKALAKITYRTIPYTQGGGASDQIITRRTERSGEFLTLRNTGVRWVGEANPIADPEAQAGLFVPSKVIAVTLHRVTPTFYATLKTASDLLIGKVNNATFEGHAAGTILYEGMSDEQTVTADGSQPYQVELRFNVRIVYNQGSSTPLGWNFFFDDSPDQGKWREMETMDGKPIYLSGDFSTLYS